MLDTLKVELTDDPLTNIMRMAPLLDETGQNKVFGLICGLIIGSNEKTCKIKHGGTS